MILDAARGVAGDRAVILQCHPQIAARFVLLGAAGTAMKPELGIALIDLDRSDS